jgi:hypothetical protein
LNVFVNIKPGVNAFATPESNKSPVPQAVAAAPPVPNAVWLVTVCGVDRIVHVTESPTEIVVTAVTRIPPVPLVQSTKPISAEPAPPQGGVISPMST